MPNRGYHSTRDPDFVGSFLCLKCKTVMPLPPTEIEQKKIFGVLVEAQDSGCSVSDSRKRIAGAYSLSIEEVIQIERNGIAAKWPPLDVTVPAPQLESRLPE